jgi:Ser/Thr protein kinase RdoA (MazF antagonist)
MYTPRRASDIQYEMELLDHLARKGIKVSRPIARRDGGFVRPLPAPEGVRQVVLFSFVPGESISPELWDRVYIRRLGEAVGRLHMAAIDFTSPHPRFGLDLYYLLERPLSLAQPLLHRRPDDSVHLEQICGRLQSQIEALDARGLSRGICHGDMLGKTNVHVTSDGELSFYDFECCGPGWLAYDIGVFAHALALLKSSDEATALLAAFLEGYQTCVELTAADLAVIPLFVAARHFWWLGLRTGNWENWGSGEVNDRAMDEWLSFWPALETYGALHIKEEHAT